MLSFLGRRIRGNVRILLVFVAGGVFWLIAALAVPGFGSMQNFRNVFLQTMILSMVAAGQTFAIISGGIDLSVPYVLSMSAAVVGVVSAGRNEPLVWVVPLVLILAACVGLFNGLGVSYLKVAPIVMTMSTNVIVSGAVVLFIGYAPPAHASSAVEYLCFGRVAGVPVPALILVATLIAVTAILTLTPYGRRLYAVGTSSTVSRFSGVNPASIVIPAYMFSSVAAALAGIILLGYVGSVYMGMGEAYLFPSIAAVIIGGASILGGSGHYAGTVAGALLLTLLTGLLIVFNFGAGAIKIFYGLIILISVWVTSQTLGRKAPVG